MANLKAGVAFLDDTGAQVNIEQIGGMIVKAVNDQLYGLALDVQQRAREYVPVDHGNAEAAIKIDKGAQRRQWAVYIDMDQPVERDNRSYTVGDYIMWLHEDQTYKLGPKSEAKNATLEHGFVGPKFLERALNDILDEGELDRISAELAEAIATRKMAAAERRIAQRNAVKEQSA